MHFLYLNSPKVFLMLLQDTNKKSYITPDNKLESQNEKPVGPCLRHCK